jgi:hypothetical protein
MLFGNAAADMKKFEDARQHCLARGGQLASTVDASEASTLANEMLSRLPQASVAKAAWIGLARVNYTATDAASNPYPTARQTTDKNLWAWLTTNKVPQYDGWRIRNANNPFPDNKASREGICADMYLTADTLNGRWDDEDCSSLLPFACESVGELCYASRTSVGVRVLRTIGHAHLSIRPTSSA